MAAKRKPFGSQERVTDILKKSDTQLIAEIRAKMGEERWNDMLRRIDEKDGWPRSTPRTKSGKRRDL